MTNAVPCKLWQQAVSCLSARLGGIAVPNSAVSLSPLQTVRQRSDTWHFGGNAQAWVFSLAPGQAVCQAQPACILPGAGGGGDGGAYRESILGVNYHLGREDLRISASHVGTSHHQPGFASGSNPDLLVHLLPSVSILDSGSVISARRSPLAWTHQGELHGTMALHLWVLPLNPTYCLSVSSYHWE